MKAVYISDSRFLLCGVAVLLAVAQNAKSHRIAHAKPSTKGVEITVLYDNYILSEGCRADWGFACMIKGTEKNVLFDTGANGTILLENMDKLQVVAEDADLIVISHDHTDHTGGLYSFLGRNSNVLVYLPSAGLVQSVESRGAKVQIPDGPLQICEQVYLYSTNRILKSRVIRQFRELGVQKVGASHCTGDRAIQLFKETYREDFVPIGVGRLGIANVCDFTDDGVVDFRDFAVCASCWRTAAGEPGWRAQADIAPPLFGDGIVDFHDIPGFVEHWLKEIGLVAHWKLDEAEGDVAGEMLADKDGTIHGDAVWQPTGGWLARCNSLA